MAEAKKKKPPASSPPEPVNPILAEDLALFERIVVGSAPPVAVGSALQGMSHAASLAMLNATQGYQNWATSMQAIAMQAAVTILSPVANDARPETSTPNTDSKRPPARAAKTRATKKGKA